MTDAPSSFAYGDQIYEPRNYKEEYHGDVTLRYALAMSLNNATVKVAEEVGYDKVADLAKSAGIVSVKATPAMALGSYDATPLDMAGAYTSFANNGARLSPILVNSVRNAKGDVVANFKTDQRQVLDPRIAYVMTNMMEGVINNGLGYTAVRLRGFTPPAAGKTGSSHDGWFAGYTSNLLCIVWVGYDDYSDLRLTGAMTAAPIWTEFMKKASALPQYSDMKEFRAADAAWWTCNWTKPPTGWLRPPVRTITRQPSWRARSRARLAISRAGWRDSSPGSLAAERSRCRLRTRRTATDRKTTRKRRKDSSARSPEFSRTTNRQRRRPKPPDTTQTPPH